jgi:endonuclease/exonuclease/phosphatase family metal-dependent hydrolase
MLRLTGVAAALSVAALSLTTGPADAATHRLPAPHRLHAVSATPNAVKLAWTHVHGAKVYRISLSTSRSMRKPRYVRSRTTRAVVRHLSPQHKYYVRVRVINPRTGRSLSRVTAGSAAAVRTKAAPAPVSTAMGPTHTAAPGVSTGAADVQAASFNLSGVNNDAAASGDMRPWRERRPVVASQILGEHADVVGLQEANMSTIYATSLDYGKTQYDDLKGAVNAQGGHYALTNEYSYNCANSTSNQSCATDYRGASADNRILYNTDTLQMLEAGSFKYAHQTADKTDRYLAWAVFRVKATGGEVFFTDTHLDPYSADSRIGEWGEMMTKIGQLSNGRPVVSVGDFNTSKFDSYAADLLPRMKAAGYGDVLNQQYSHPAAVSPRAATRVNVDINSFNGYRRDVSAYAYGADSGKIGNNIDWVFASNDLVVKQWKTVINYDPSTMQVRGVIPSDHNMVDATITIP